MLLLVGSLEEKCKRIRKSRQRSKELFFTIISVYAPTARAPAIVKSIFLEQLQDALDGVLSTDFLVL